MQICLMERTISEWIKNVCRATGTLCRWENLSPNVRVRLVVVT